MSLKTFQTIHQNTLKKTLALSARGCLLTGGDGDFEPPGSCFDFLPSETESTHDSVITGRSAIDFEI